MNLKNEKKVYKSYSDAILLPKLIQLNQNLIMASFQLMKLMPAKYVIEKALKEGKIDPTYPIVETSSGTYALGLGIVCAEHGIPFYIISDPAIDNDLQRRLEYLGGRVQILSQTLKESNPQVFRLNTLKEYLAVYPKCYWPSQYDNPDNQAAYSKLAEFLVEQLGANITLVGSVGSGGSTCGTIKYLREKNQSSKLIGVDTFGSVLFGLQNDKRILRGLGNSILPKNLDHHLFDEVHWVSAKDAYIQTRRMHAKYAAFHGPTTGAAYHVAKWVAQQNKNETVVFIAPDTGYRYQTTVYNDHWLKEVGFYGTELSYCPNKVTKPSHVQQEWSYINWNRRTYSQIVGDKV